MKKSIQLRRNESPTLETQMWLRFLAFMIDSFIVRLFAILLVAFGVRLFQYLVSGDLSDNAASEIHYSALRKSPGALLGLNILAFVLYASILESSRMQGTIGKWFLRYKVCDRAFDRISFPRSFLRNLLKIVSILTVIGIFIIDMTAKRQGLHDLIARTVIIRR